MCTWFAEGLVRRRKLLFNRTIFQAQESMLLQPTFMNSHVIGLSLCCTLAASNFE